LLLHSLSVFAEVILPCLDIVGARTLVEVGSEEGTFTRNLVTWVERAGGTLYCVDPEPSEKLVELCDTSDAVRLVRGYSPRALEALEKADAYVIDGDHNYYTVSGELEVIERQSRDDGGVPLVFVHDIGWPCGRRDQYYSPESLPPEALHPYTYERGVRPGCNEAVEGGFRSGGEFAVATEEGGERNGVLTAVEDFLRDRDDLALAKVPCVFGLGVIHRTSSPEGKSLGEFLEAYDGHALLERMEANRLDLYLNVLDLQDVINDMGDSLLRLRDVTTENRALWARNAELEAHLELLTDEASNLLDSRAFALAERLATLRGSSALSRDRLRAVLEREQPV
jgi:hypothetical protein